MFDYNNINLNKFPYDDMRDGQREVLQKLKDNWHKYRYFVLELPTGFGKSALAKTICESGIDSYILTATKQLQDQYVNDFPFAVETIKGKSNYQCEYNPKLTCDIGPCLVNKELIKECRDKCNCPYYEARDRAAKSKITVTSYPYFLRMIEMPAKVWKRRSNIIVDECHLLEQQLTSWAGVVIKPRELHEKYEIFEGIPFDQFVVLSEPPEVSGYQANKNWLNKIWDLLVKKRNSLYEELKDQMDGKEPDELTEDELDGIASTNKAYFDLDRLFRRLQIFFHAKDQSNWIVEPQDDGIIIQPVNTGILFQKYMNDWGLDHIVFMSATILDIKGFCNELGIPREQVGIIRMEPTFDPEKSPIVFRACGKMDYRNLDNTIPKIVEEVKNILAEHPNDKGIIHTGNYKIARAIVEGVKDSRLLIKEDKESNESLMGRHANSKEPTVLVSPSLHTGADLKDDLSRFQIAVKLPWPSLGDKRVQKKIEQNGDWYAGEMFRSFIQACGRSTRSEEDWSTTYVLDSSFYSWTYKYRSWFPKQYLKRIKWKRED